MMSWCQGLIARSKILSELIVLAATQKRFNSTDWYASIRMAQRSKEKNTTNKVTLQITCQFLRIHPGGLHSFALVSDIKYFDLKKRRW